MSFYGVNMGAAAFSFCMMLITLHDNNNALSAIFYAVAVGMNIWVHYNQPEAKRVTN